MSRTPSALTGIITIVLTLAGWSSVPLFVRHFAGQIARRKTAQAIPTSKVFLDPAEAARHNAFGPATNQRGWIRSVVQRVASFRRVLRRGHWLAVLAASASVHGQCGYDVTIIEAPSAPPPGVDIDPTAINSTGGFTGYYAPILSDFYYGMVWTAHGGFVTLDMPSTIESVQPYDLNDKWIVTGTLQPQGGGWRAFTHDGKSFTILDPLPGGDWSFGAAINEAGVVVGSSQNLTQLTITATQWNGSKIDVIEGLAGPDNGAVDVNNAGQITGWMIHFNESIGFVWDHGQVVSLGPVPGGTTSRPRAINDEGVVVGDGRVPCQCSPHTSARQAFLWKNGMWTMLGTLPGLTESFALDVNEDSQVVGYSWDFGSFLTPFIWRDGTMYDLNELVPDTVGLQVNVPGAINDAGQIIADGTIPGLGEVAAILTPIPGPIGDLNADCLVTVNDLGILLAEWGDGGSVADLNDDGAVVPFDLALLLSNWS